MPKYQNTIEYNITTKLDAKGLTQLQTQIREIETSLQRLASKDLNDPFKFNESAQELEKLNKALSSSFNSSIGMLDLSKLKTELKDAGVSAQSLGKAFADGGAQGRIAFNNLLGQIGKIDTGLKRSSTTIDKMFNTISNTVRWGIVSSGFSAMLNSLHQSVDYVKELDNSMTQIMLVTDYSRQQMNDYAKSANEAAKALGNTTVGVMQGTQIFAQQGYNLEQSGQLAGLSIKLANASEQDSTTTSDQITALMNAYNLDGNIENLSKALDSWALVANVSAADVEELAKASQKAASSASTVGVGLDQMNAQIATIESVTRDAPEQIGNGLKTLYARLSDISLGQTLEDGVDLGKVTGVLDRIGVEVLDQAGQMRNVGDIIEDLMVVWDSLDQTSKEAAGQAIAGKYQLNRFYALMDNSDMYREYKASSENAEGTLDQMNAEYLDSAAGRAAKLQATLEGLFNSVFNPDNFYPAIDALTSFIDLIKQLVDSIGGGQTILTGAIALFGRLFSNNMAQTINDANYNRQMNNIRKQNAENVPAILDQLGFNSNDLTSDQKGLVDYVKYIQQNQGFMSETQAQDANQSLEDGINALNRYEEALEKAKISAQELNLILTATGEEGMKAFVGEDGKWDTNGVLEELQNFDDPKIEQVRNALSGKLEKDLVGKNENSLLTYFDKLQQAGREWVTSTSEDQLLLQKKYDTLSESIDKTRNRLQELKGSLDPSTYNTLSAAIDKAESEYKELGADTDSATDKAKEAIRIFEDLKKALGQAQTDVKSSEGVDRAVRRALSDASNINAAEANKENAERTRKGIIDSTDSQKQIKSILDTTSAIGELAFAWQSFQNLGSIWNNADLEPGEKLLQTITNISFALPSFINALNTIKENQGISKLFSGIIDVAKTNLDKVNPLRVGKEKVQSQREDQKSTLQLQIEEKKQELVKNEIEIEELRKKQAELSKRIHDIDVEKEDYRRNPKEKFVDLNKRDRQTRQTFVQEGLKADRTKTIAELGDITSKIDETKSKNLELTNSLEGLTGEFEELGAKGVSNLDALKGGFSSVLSSVGSSVLSNLPMILITGVITAVTMYLEHLEAVRKKHEEVFNELKSESDSINQNIDNFINLTQTYQETKKASDELVNTAKELADQLDIAGADAMIAANNFTGLKDAIDEANNAKLDNLIAAAEDVRHDEFNGGQTWTEGSLAYDLGTDKYKRPGFNIFTGDSALLDENVSKIFKDTNWNKDSNDFVIITQIEERLKQLRETRDEINKLLKKEQDENKKQELQTSLDRVNQAIDPYQDLLNRDTTKKLKEAQQSELESRFKQDSFQEQLEGLKTTDEIIKALSQDSDEMVAGFFGDSTIDQLQKVQIALQGITDESQRTILMLTQENAAFTEKMTQKAQGTIQDQIDNNGLDINQLGAENSQQYAEYVTQDLQDRIKNSGLTEKEQLEFLASIDWNQSLEEIYKQVEEINSSESLPKLDFEPTLTDRSDFSQEETDSILKETKMSESALDRMSSDIFKDAEGLGGRAQEIEKELKELYDTIEDGKTPTEEQAEQIAELRQEYENLGDTAKDIATYNLQMNKGISNLVKNWKNYADVLSDDASKGTSDYYQALGELDEIMSDILNIDIGVLPKSFYENADAIDAMRRAAEGDAAAIDDLRRIAAEEIILNLQFENLEENENVDDLRQELYGLLNEFQGLLDGAPLGMTVDCQTDPFIQKLNELLAASKITEEQASNILSSIGMEATIKYAEEEREQEVTQYFPSFHTETVPIVAAAGGSSAEGSVTKIVPDDPIPVTYTEHSKVSIPYIEGAAYTGPGVRTVGAASSGSAPHSTSGGSSGGRGGSGGSGGGGGGGSEKTYEPKQKDPIEEEVDLYEKVNTQLDDVQETLEGIEEEEDRLIGPDARANLNKQLELLQKEIKLQKQKLEIQRQERNDLASQLSSRFGVTFDSEGFISNYAAVLKQLEQRYNDLVNEYNNATTEERQEELAKAIDEAKDNIDKFKDLYQRYDTLQGKEIKETQNDIEKLRDKIEDLRISAYKAAQSAIDDLKELRDNAAELLGLFTDYKSDSPFRATIVDAAKLKNIFGGTKKEAIDYYQTLIDKNQKLADSATDAASKAAYRSQVKFFKQQQKSAAKNPLGTGALGLASQDLARLQQWIDNPNAADNPFGKNTSALYEAYEDAYNRMRSLALEAEQAWEQLEKDIIEGYEKIAEQEEDMSKRFDRLTKNLETLGDVLTLVKGEDEYGDLAKIYQQIGQTTLVQAQQQKEILKAWQDRYNSIEDKTSDIAKTVREQMEAAEDKLIELQKSVVENWQKAFENAIKEITAKENQRLLGVRSIEDTSSDWERDKKYAEDYYDDVQKAMAIEQLRLKYMDLLDDAQNSNLDIQNRIRDAMNEQVKYLEDQEHLSEFNVKYANAQLEILQKQIALEDARNNKNQMRLRRDTQGNYRYVYSANQDEVRDKEADLLQAEFDAYNMSNENRMNTYTEWLAYYQNYQQQREAIIQRMEQGDAEAADALRKLEEDFARDMKAYSEELGDSWDGMIGALTWMAETGTETIKESAEIAMQAIRDKTDESLNAVGIQWNETIDGAIENIQKLLRENTEATKEMIRAAQEYKDEITEVIAPLTTTSFTDINAAVQSAASSTRDLAQASRELQEALLGDNAQLVEAQQQLEKYRKQLDKVKNSSAITAQQLRRAQEELDRTKAENLNYRTQIDDLQYRIDHPSESQSGGSSGGGGSGSGGFRVGDTVGFHGWYYYDSWGTDPAGNLYADKPNAVRIAEWSSVSLGGYQQTTGDFTASLVATDGTWLGWVKPEQLFDTGGYTGEWNDSSGKIAMLHQKELVLNQTDTENILNAVNMVRNMADMLKLFTGISSMKKGTSYNKLGGDTIEQRVEITAEFPNVQDSNEIEKALLNLADSAYQYSYR